MKLAFGLLMLLLPSLPTRQLQGAGVVSLHALFEFRSADLYEILGLGLVRVKGDRQRDLTIPLIHIYKN